MHRRWYCDMSPTTRAAYRAFRAAEDEDARTRHAWMDEDDAEPPAVAEAEYEHWFGPGRDRRAAVAKLVDIRAWEGEEPASPGEPPARPRAYLRPR
ncbi:MAG: hypothetical protein B7Z08_09155 [Sphingomonadales bacterium 32-68-7]|nr:MAG: hypothetical protein B7Z33_11795 [Sphingomonadales bacterium 12-68-11]OYX08465.1 MAG: hypothetical protein B7Z08_09155 [Sphingomonadales bacterium 32-68-7]